MRDICKLILATLIFVTQTHTAASQSFTAEEKFQDVFITAGYATAFGAALGAALLAFESHPEQNLRHIAIGASLGFIGGSALGTYMVMSPGIVSIDSPAHQSTLADTTRSGVTIQPLWHLEERRFAGVLGGFKLQF